MTIITHNNTSHSNKALHAKDLAAKLQFEIDSILTDVSEESLFAEFQNEQCVDLHEGAANDFGQNSLDERMLISPMAKIREERRVNRERQITAVTETTSKVTKQATKKAGSAFRFLFTSFSV